MTRILRFTCAAFGGGRLVAALFPDGTEWAVFLTEFEEGPQ